MAGEKRSGRGFRWFMRQAHMVLGLASGLVVFIVAVTGCLWVFQEEIGELLRDEPTVVAKEGPLVTPTAAKETALGVYPGRGVHGVLYGRRDEPVEVIFYEPDPEFYSSVSLDPYSGEVLEAEDRLEGFFPFVLEGHMHLWMPEEIGKQVVGWSCMIFVVMLITGIILWWPRNRGSRGKRLRFVWNPTTRWKRKNWDLHAILGFYAGIVALLAALTGLIMVFDWMREGVYTALGGEKTVAFVVPDASPYTPDATTAALAPIDNLLPRLRAEYPEAEQFEIHYPHSDSASIYVEITYERGVYYSSDYRFYDQRTLAEVETPSIYGTYAEADVPDMIMRMNYDIHVGAILGLPGKILMFLASLVVASLPVTGTLLWWGRRKRARGKAAGTGEPRGRQMKVPEAAPARPASHVVARSSVVE